MNTLVEAAPKGVRTTPVEKHYALIAGKEFRDCLTQQEQGKAHELANEVAGDLISLEAVASLGYHAKVAIHGVAGFNAMVRMNQMVEYFSYGLNPDGAWHEAPLSLLFAVAGKIK